MVKLSIIVPAYNEEENLKNGVLDQMDDYLKKVDYSYEVLIVDDKSPDKTAEIVKDLIKNKKNFHLLENEHGGKAITVMTGVLASKGEIALYIDMDQSTPLKELEKILPEFDKGFDIVMGSRKGRSGAPLIRNIATLGFIVLREVILGLPFKDTQCGFKGLTRKAAEAVFPEMLERWKKNPSTGASTNASFDVEMLYLAKKKGLKIKEVPVEWHYVGSERFNLVHDALETIKGMLRIRWNDIRGNYR